MRAILTPTALALFCLPPAPAQGTARQHVEKGLPDVRSGALTTASAAFEAALQADAAGDRAWWPLAHVNLAIIARLRGTPARGFGHLDQAKQLLSEAPANDPLALLTRRQMLGEYGACFIAIGVLDRAEEAIQQQVDLTKSGHPTEKAAAALALINLRLAQGNIQEALSEIRAALRKPEIRDGAAMANELRVRELMAKRCITKEPGAARLLAHEFDALVSELGDASTQARPEQPLDADLRMRLNLDRIAVHLQAGNHDRALELAAAVLAAAPRSPMHVLGARTLAARAQLARSAPEAELRAEQEALAAALEAVYATFRREPPRLGGVGALQFSDQRDGLVTLLSLDRRLDGAAAAETAFTHLEAAFALGSLTRRMSAQPGSWTRVQRELVPQDGGVLMCLVSEHKGHVLAIERGGTTHHEFVVDDTFRHDVADVTQTVESTPSDTSAAGIARLRPITERLADRILGPVLRQRMERWRSLQVISADQLSDSIWSVLPWRDSWLGLHLAIVHAPSAGLALRLLDRTAERAAPTSAPTLDFAVLADAAQAATANAHWGLESLGLTAPERQALLGTGKSKGWFGPDAKVSALRNAEFADAAAWCIVAHGVQDYTREMFAGLLLAPDAIGDTVFPDAIATLRPPPIVVLAVCNGGSGPKRRGDASSAHLSGAFLANGSDAVVVASGALAVGPTLDLLAALQRELAAGASLAEALRRARVSIATDAARAHPHFFAGLRVVGRDRRLR